MQENWHALSAPWYVSFIAKIVGCDWLGATKKSGDDVSTVATLAQEPSQLS
jgi:hypothetical protein